jgi:hypothetical protein
LQPVIFTYAPTATDDDGIALSQTPSGATALTLNGVLVASGTTYAQLGAQQFITISCAGADAGRTFTVVGTGLTGQRVTFTMAGSNAGVTVSTVGVYRVISVTPDAATAGAVKVGVNGTGRSYPVIMDYFANPTTVSIYIVVTGTIDWTVQDSPNDPQNNTGGPDTWTWFDSDDAALVTTATNAKGNYAFPPHAIALLVNSSSGGTATVTITQATTTP